MADLVLALAFFAVVLPAVVSFVVVRRVVRGTRRIIERAVRDHADHVVLTTRARLLPPGTGRELAVLRRDLRASLRETAAGLRYAAAAGQPAGELAAAFAGLERAGLRVDADLARLEREPNPGLQREVRPALLREAGRIITATAHIRRDLYAASSALSAGTVEETWQQIDEERTLLRHHAQTLARWPWGHPQGDRPLYPKSRPGG